MPQLKGSNMKAKATIYNSLNKPKKPTRKEKLDQKLNFQNLLANDELCAEQNQAQQVSQNQVNNDMRDLALNAPTSLQIASGDAVLPEDYPARGDAEMAMDDDQAQITPTKKTKMAMRRRDRTPTKNQEAKKK